MVALEAVTEVNLVQEVLEAVEAEQPRLMLPDTVVELVQPNKIRPLSMEVMEELL